VRELSQPPLLEREEEENPEDPVDSEDPVDPEDPEDPVDPEDLNPFLLSYSLSYP
jgi:hypothetical protein